MKESSSIILQRERGAIESSWAKDLTATLLLILFSGSAMAADTIPAGISDPGRSVWFQVGETNDLILGLNPKTSVEGGMSRITIDGIPAITVVTNRDPCKFLYMDVADWFSATDVMLNIEYYDSGMGVVLVNYDTFGTEVIASDRVTCEGSQEWKITHLHLPEARFSNGCNGNDFRLEVNMTGDFTFRGVWITAVSTNAPIPRRQIEFVNTNDLVTETRAADDNERFVLSDADYEYTFAPAGLLKVVYRPGRTAMASSDAPYIPFSYSISKGRSTLRISSDEIPTKLRVIGDSNNLSAVEYVVGFPEMSRAKWRIEKAAAGLTRVLDL